MRRLLLVVLVFLVVAFLVVALAAPGARAAPGGGDPFQQEQWALAKVGAPAAWPTATGAGAVIAVVDTGVDRDHPELRDVLTGGASWIDCGPEAAKPCLDSSKWDDRNGHGTHVAGIAAAPLDGVGVVGVAPGAQIMPIRVLGAAGTGDGDDVAAGVRWAADHGADVVNLSLGGLPVVSQLVDGTGVDQAFADAIAYAISKGVLVVAAAGNESAPLCDDDSFRVANAVCVGATDRRDLKAWFGNFGGGTGGAADRPGLDVVAPGGLGSVLCDDPEDVLSTYAISEDTVCTRRVGYETLAGTSMAAPHVSGIGALLAQLGTKGTDAAQRILATADDLGTPGWDPVFGYGRVNAERAVTATG
ncbi:MAG: S8 family serine peptidase [Acidimicrobiales bacterium]